MESIPSGQIQVYLPGYTALPPTNQSLSSISENAE
jgi:hypothetical protein